MRLSLQLYTLRDAMASDFDGTLAAVRDTGLEYVELAGYYDKSASEFAEILDGYSLKASGMHVGVERLESDFDAVVSESRAFGNEWVIVPYIGQDRRNWTEFGKTLSALGEKLKGEGLSLAYHNHDFEFGPDQGLRQLIASSHPSLVSFQVDVGWVAYAREDPAKLLWDLGPRAPLVHLKDLNPDCENPHVLVGEGAVQWDQVLAACDGIGVQFGAIEMDHPPTDPVGDVRRSVEFFHARGLS